MGIGRDQNFFSESHGRGNGDYDGHDRWDSDRSGRHGGNGSIRDREFTSIDGNADRRTEASESENGEDQAKEEGSHGAVRPAAMLRRVPRRNAGRGNEVGGGKGLTG